MNRVLVIVGLVAGIPLVLWADVWLAFQFGQWVNRLIVTDDGSAGGMLGFFSFFVLAGVQGGAAWVAAAKS